MADSKALLSQEEIDVLVSFLSVQKDTISNDVMSQESIDKLIDMLNSGIDGQAIMNDATSNVINDRSLLGQTEIDALVNFLTSHKTDEDNTILTQDKIDQLVQRLLTK